MLTRYIILIFDTDDELENYAYPAGEICNENHFVNFTGATFALATHVYTSMHKGRLHQQVCRAT